MSQISQQRQGGITSGKPIVNRGPPEVTISKTSSPRGSIGYNSEVANNPLTSLVDVAVQQPKLDLTAAIRQQQAIAQMMAHVTPKAASLVTAVSAFYWTTPVAAFLVVAMHFSSYSLQYIIGWCQLWPIDFSSSKRELTFSV